MKPFRLLDLPFLVIKKIGNDPSINIVFLALCSEKCNRIVKSMKIKTEKLLVHYHDDRYYVELQFQSYRCVFWHFVIRNNEPEDFEFEFTIRKQVYKTRIRECQSIESSCDDCQGAIENYVEFLKATFDCQLNGYQITPLGCPNHKGFILDKINKDPNCVYFTFGAYNSIVGEYLYPRIETEDVKFIFDNLKKNIELTIIGKLDDDFQYKEQLSFKKLVLAQSQWFQKDHFFKSSCEQLYLPEEQNIEISDINLYLKQWINGDHSRIQYFYLKSHGFYKSQSKIKLLNGIELHEHDQTRNVMNYKKSFFHTILNDSKFLFSDICRRDGTTGTIALEDFGIHFHVWQLKPSNE